MRMFTRLFLAAGLLVMASCDMMVPPWQLSDLKHTAKQPVTCTAGEDCDRKWALALKWARKNTPLAIATQTDSLITTVPSIELSPSPAFTITKIRDGDTGDYRILLDVSCADSFGCLPPALKLRAGFVAFVMGNGATIQ